jgi:hypothetical protein
VLDILYYTLHPVNYTAPHRATLHPLSFAAPHWPMLHPTLRWAVVYWSFAQPFLAIPPPTELRCTLLRYHPPPLSYATTYLTTLHTFWSMLHLTELCCSSHIYAAPHIATLHPTKLRCTPQSYQHPVNYTAPYWATQHPASNDAPYWAMLYPVPHWASLYPTELPNNLRAALHPTELRCTPLSYGAQTLRKEMMNDNLIKQYPWSEVLDNI